MADDQGKPPPEPQQVYLSYQVTPSLDVVIRVDEMIHLLLGDLPIFVTDNGILAIDVDHLIERFTDQARELQASKERWIAAYLGTGGKAGMN